MVMANQRKTCAFMNIYGASSIKFYKKVQTTFKATIKRYYIIDTNEVRS